MSHVPWDEQIDELEAERDELSRKVGALEHALDTLAAKGVPVAEILAKAFAEAKEDGDAFRAAFPQYFDKEG